MNVNYYDVDDVPDLFNFYLLIYNLQKNNMIGRIRRSTSGKNFHIEKTTDYQLYYADSNYPNLCQEKEVSTVCSKLWQYVWCGKEVRKLVGQASDWFTLDEFELANVLDEVG